MPQHKDKIFRYNPGNPEPELISQKIDGKWDPVAPWELPDNPQGDQSE